jgi:hypothetical protein
MDFYIESHEEDVMVDYQQILERHWLATYSPEVQAKLARNRETFRVKVEAQ